MELDLEDMEEGTRQLKACLEEKAVSDSLLLAGLHYFKSEVFRKKSKRDSFRYHIGLATDYVPPSLEKTHWLYQYIRHREGIVAYYDGDYAQVRKVFDEVKRLYDTAGDRHFGMELDMIINYGNYYEKVDSLDMALQTYNRGIGLSEAETIPFGEDRLGVIYTLLATIYEKQGDLLKALSFAKKGADIFFSQHDDTDPQAMIIYNNLGGDYLSVNNFPKAVLYIEKAYECFLQDHGPNETPGDVILNNLGNCYQKMGDIEKASKAFEQAIAIRTKVYGSDHVRTALSEFNASSMYVAVGRPEETIRLLKSCRPKLVRLAGPNHPHIAKCDQNLAIAYRANGDYDEALASYQSALAIMEVNYPPEYIGFAVTMRNLSGLFYKQEDYNKALYWIEKAIAIEEESLEGGGARKGYVSGIYATTLFKAGRQVEAFERYEESFLRLGLPDPSSVTFDTLEDPRSAVGVLGFYLDDVWSAYQEAEEEIFLEKIIARASQGISILEWQRSKFSGDQMKTLWTHQNYRIFEHLITANLRLFEKTQNPELLSTAEAYAERAKGSILLDALLQSGVSRFAGVPDEVVEENARLRNELSFLELTLNSADEEEAIKSQEELFAKQLALNEHQKKVARDYPKYSELFAEQKATRLESMGEDILPGHATISYFLGEEHLAVFVRTEAGLKHVLLPLPEGFFEELEAYITLLSEPPSRENGDPFQEFVSGAVSIYRTVFAPVKDLLSESVEYLLIIPDGALNYLPFETLLGEQPSEDIPFSDLPYLLNKYQICYAPSRAVWQEMHEQEVPSRGILAVAPSFNETDSAQQVMANSREDFLGPLVFNRQEAASVCTFGQARGLYGVEANRQNFEEAYPKADILHLATHGKVEETDSKYSYLAFAGAEAASDSGRLYLSTIYAMNMSMNMVVLSACETGLGKLRRGEGLMSMARGFAYAGAKSIVPSLWSVNDLSTATLMENYYGELATGKRKDSALRSAKMNYLEATKAQPEAHPYYWAAFVVIGDAESMDFHQGFSSWPWLLIVLLPLAWGLYRYRVSKRQGD